MRKLPIRNFAVLKKRIEEVVIEIGEPMADGSYLAGCNKHELEDDLYKDFIRFLSERKDNVGKMATELLRIVDLENYERWYS